LAGQRLRDAGELEHHATRLDDRNPALGRALAGAHARLRRLLRERLVRAAGDPALAAAADLAGHRDPGCLALPVGDPAVVEGLDPEVAVLHVELARRMACAAPAELLAVLGLPRHQHQASPPFVSGFASGVVSGGVAGAVSTA